MRKRGRTCASGDEAEAAAAAAAPLALPHSRSLTLVGSLSICTLVCYGGKTLASSVLAGPGAHPRPLDPGSTAAPAAGLAAVHLAIVHAAPLNLDNAVDLQVRAVGGTPLAGAPLAAPRGPAPTQLTHRRPGAGTVKVSLPLPPTGSPHSSVSSTAAGGGASATRPRCPPRRRSRRPQRAASPPVG